MTIGELIKSLRLSHGLSQDMLAEKSGIALTSIQKYEIGVRNPKTDQLNKIADALGVSANIFLDIKANTVSDVFSLIFNMKDQLDITLTSNADETVSLTFNNNAINHGLYLYTKAEEAINKEGSIESKASLESLKTTLLNDNTPVGSKSVKEDTYVAEQHMLTSKPLLELQEHMSKCTPDNAKLIEDIAKLLTQKLK